VFSSIRAGIGRVDRRTVDRKKGGKPQIAHEGDFSLFRKIVHTEAGKERLTYSVSVLKDIRHKGSSRD
jgi:hypothetical protein